MANECPKCQTSNPEDSKFCKDCGTPLSRIEEAVPTKTMETPAEELTTGSTFAGRYQIIEELGKGGMGRVYKAVDTKLKEKVALKLIKPEIASSKKTLERFSNELKISRKIVHKNIGRMYELMEEKGRHFITMEYVSGQDLKKLIRQSAPLSIPRTLSIAKQICEGLSEAHSQGVIHRDLKPSNIMIDTEGATRIMDFGIARSLKAKGITGPGLMVGTPEYMSPEQAEAKDVDLRTDIYSLGIILFEMTTGRLPFEGETSLAVAMKHKGEAPKNPKEFNPQIPDDLAGIILKCLEKEKDSRYQRANDVRADLEKIEQGMPTTDRIIPPKKPLTSKEITVTFGLKKWLIPAIAVIALAAIGLILWSPWSKEKSIPIPTDKPSIAVLYFENNTGEENLDNWRDNISAMLTADLSQSKFLYVLSADRVYGILKKQNLLEAEKYSPDELKKVAEQGGVNHILTGSYAKDEDMYLVTFFLNRIDTGQMIKSQNIQGNSIPSIIDLMTLRTKEALNLSQAQIDGDIDREAARITTSSPEALKYYIQARRRGWNDDWSGSIELYKKAIAIDNEFAMAYRGMGVCYHNLLYTENARRSLQKAMDLADRLSEREKLQIIGDLAWNSGKNDEALQAFEKLLAQYPEDTLANHNQGVVYNSIGDTEKADESYKRAVEYKTDFPITYITLAARFRSQNQEEKAQAVLKQYIDRFGPHPVIHEYNARRFMSEENFGLALSEINKALALDPDYRDGILTKGNIFFYTGELAKAEAEYLSLLKDEDNLDNGRVLTNLGELYLLQGKFNKSRERTQEGLELVKGIQERWAIEGWNIGLAYVEYVSDYPDLALEILSDDFDFIEPTYGDYPVFKSYALYLEGLAYLKKGSLDKARENADELKILVDRNEASTEYYNHMLGKIEQERRNYREAIKHIEEAISESSNNIFFLYSAATAYLADGDLNNAQARCERIQSLTTGRLFYGLPDYNDLFGKSYHLLGKIFEQQGNISKAIDNYEKFLDLWKDADPGLPEVEDAKTRLARLKN